MTRLLNFSRCVLFGIAATSLFAQDKTADPQLAPVTFYSTGSFWKSSVPGYNHGPFDGMIFDGKSQLAHISPGHFVTFNLSPGQHIFAANYWVSRTSKGGAHLKIDLAPNHHYYVGTYFKTTPLLVLSTPRIEQASCEDAQKHAQGATPLESKHVDKESITLLVSESAFPHCS